jgi:hypothetical protein
LPVLAMTNRAPAACAVTASTRLRVPARFARQMAASSSVVVREADLADRRRKAVVLTDAGRGALKDAKAASDKAERQLLADQSPREAERLRDLLARIATR